MQWIPVFAVLIPALALLGGVLVYIIRAEIAKATKPIQPDANGGKSLPDVAANTELIKARQADLINDIRDMRARFDAHLEGHL